MKVGSFITPERIDQLAAAGGEYGELFATRTFMVGDRDDFDAFARLARQWPIEPIAFSGLVPSELKLCGPDADRAQQANYLDELFHRIETLARGHRVLATIGSAGARNIPDGFDVQRALDQIADFLELAGGKARSTGVTLNLEHLHRGESNVFNTIRSCGDFIRDRGLADLHLVADLYHLMMEQEPISVVGDYAELITHAHVADTDRDGPGTGDYPIEEFLTALREAGYDGDCSIEAFWTDFDTQVGLGIRTVRAAARAAGYQLTVEHERTKP